MPGMALQSQKVWYNALQIHPCYISGRVLFYFEAIIPMYRVLCLPHQFTYQWVGWLYTLHLVNYPAMNMAKKSLPHCSLWPWCLAYIHVVRCGVTGLYGSLGMSVLFWIITPLSIPTHGVKNLSFPPHSSLFLNWLFKGHSGACLLDPRESWEDETWCTTHRLMKKKKQPLRHLQEETQNWVANSAKMQSNGPIYLWNTIKYLLSRIIDTFLT